MLQAHIEYAGKTFVTDLAQPIDISIAVARSGSPNAFYLQQPVFTTVQAGDFTGNVQKGGSCNCEDITFNPHGNGTHTEGAGHISEETIYIKDVLKDAFLLTTLITVTPVAAKDGLVITKELLQQQIPHNHLFCKALAVRTTPNNPAKKNKNYSGSNPPYFTTGAIEFINSLGIEHLLTDLPSVDKEDDATLAAHHVFFTEAKAWNLQKTITELIYVPDAAATDGLYWLNLQIASFESDASPSKPLLFKTRLVQ